MKFRSLRKWSLAIGLGALLSASGTTQGQSSDGIVDLLVRKGIITDKEAKELKEQIDGDINRAINRANKIKAPSFIDQMVWSGDFRVRMENFSMEKNPTTGVKIADDRLRYRARLRFGFESKYKEWATFGARLSLGNNDPVSTNQSFEDTFSRKPLNVDLAYISIKPPNMDWIQVDAGKIKNPIWQTGISSPLQYDHDVTPEGIAEKFWWRFGEEKQHRVFVNLGQFVLDEVGGNVNDAYLFEFQGGIEAKFKRVKFTGALGYYVTHNLELMGVIAGNQPAGATVGQAQSASPNRGNATAVLPAIAGGAGGALGYLEDFKVLTGRAEIAWTVSDRKLWGGTPFLLTFSAEYLTNMAGRYENPIIGGAAIGDETEGYSFQVGLGEAKSKGQWQVAYQYKYLEADATWDAITDSDWGSGGTDRRGHVFKAAYNVLDWWQVNLTVFATDKISNRPNTTNFQRGFRGEDMIRIQLDAVFKF
jgi:hypothetical protein